MQPLRVRHGQRTCAHVFGKQPAQMTTRYAKPVGKVLYVAIIERAIGNEAQASLYRCRSPLPRRGAGRALRPAPQTGPVPGFACCSSRRVKSNILTLGGIRGADRSAVDTGGPDAHVEAAIETGIPR